MPFIAAEEELWEFDGLSFAREVPATGGYVRRPRMAAVFSVDHVLDTDEAYRDYGGKVLQPFQITAGFNTEDDAEDFIDQKLGVAGTLSGPRFSGTAMLTEAGTTYRNGEYVVADLTFT